MVHALTDTMSINKAFGAFQGIKTGITGYDSYDWADLIPQPSMLASTLNLQDRLSPQYICNFVCIVAYEFSLV